MPPWRDAQLKAQGQLYFYVFINLSHFNTYSAKNTRSVGPEVRTIGK